MRLLVITLLLGCGLLLAGWTSAQPPTGETQEPPVRLKKKKKAQPDKPEVKPEKPDRPETPPELKKKPKLDEDADLDPRDDLKLPGNKESEEDEIIQRIARNTRLAEEKLANREVGEGTRKLQEEILKDLTHLIEKSQQDQQNNQDQQSGKDSKEDNSSASGTADQKSKSSQRSAQERAERKKRRGSSQQTAQRPQGGEQPRQGTTQSNANNDRAVGSLSQGKDRDPNKKFDLWGHLPEKERALMNKEMEQKFMEKYDDLTKQYYRTIAEKSRRK